MNQETLIRAAASAVAVAILAAPYWQIIALWALIAVEHVKARKNDLVRVAVASLVVAFAWGKIPLPRIATPVVRVEVDEPSPKLKKIVGPIGTALRDADYGDRALWAAVWSKASAVVKNNDPSDGEAKIKNTSTLRAILLVSLDLGWRRIGGHKPGEYKGLREAVELAFETTVGNEQKPLDKTIEQETAELFNAIAWAGLHGG